MQIRKKVNVIRQNDNLLFGKTETGELFITNNNFTKPFPDMEFANFNYFGSLETDEGKTETIIFKSSEKYEDALRIFDLLVATKIITIYESLEYIQYMLELIDTEINMQKLAGDIGELTFLIENKGRNIKYNSDLDPVDFLVDDKPYEIKTVFGNSQTIFVKRQQLENSKNTTFVVYSAKLSNDGISVSDMISKCQFNSKKFQHWLAVKDINKFKFKVTKEKEFSNSDIKFKVKSNSIVNFVLEINYSVIK